MPAYLRIPWISKSAARGKLVRSLVSGLICCGLSQWCCGLTQTQTSTPLASVVDHDSSGSVCDGIINGSEYGNLTYFTTGVNNGFGNVIGGGSKIYMDSSGAGTFTIGIQSGGGSLNDVVVFYLDTTPGGLADTGLINDTADRGRAAISGAGTSGGKSLLTFASGFAADYALAVDYSTANLFRINANGALTWIKSAQLTPATSAAAQQREMQILLSDIGTQDASVIKWVATLINSSNAYRSNEFHGSTYAGANVGTNPFVFDNYNIFVSVASSGTGIYSPVVSYQYYDSLASSGTEPNIFSPVVSYQYYDWPGDENLTFQYSPVVSYRFSGTPQIVTQPTSRILKLGSSTTLSVVADGSPPLTYQWRFNGHSIPNTAGASIALDNLQATDSGNYSVVVSNASGSVVSHDAHVIVYASPATPKPALPALVAATQTPSAQQTSCLLPTSTQLKVLGAGGTIDPSKDTIVMTHGWIPAFLPAGNKDGIKGWPTEMAGTLVAKGYDVNILAWDWTANARRLSPSNADGPAVAEGVALANALMDALGPSYGKHIHFLGHSLGTIVNRAAADYLHGDWRPPFGETRPATEKYPYANTHMTLLDEAETAVTGAHVILDAAFATNLLSSLDGDGSGPQITNYFSRPIPKHSAWVENYVSMVGVPHLDAVNVLLWQETSIFHPIAAHGYAYDWYRETIVDSHNEADVSELGHRYSFERNTMGSWKRPQIGKFYLQYGSKFGFKDVEQSISSTLVVAGNKYVLHPTEQAFKVLSSIGNTVAGSLHDGIQYSGSMSANYSESLSSPIGTPIYMSEPGSSAALFQQADTPVPTGLQGNWDLQFSIQQGAAQPQNRTGAKAMVSSTSAEGPVYTIIPVHVPNEAVGVSFEYSISGSAADEFMTMGIGTSNEYTMQARFLDDGAWNGTPIIPVSELHDQEVQFVFTLNGPSAAPTGTLSVRNIQFYIPPRPQLVIDKAGNSLTASWPVSAKEWTIETTTDLSNPNGWQPVTLPPNDTDFFHTMTFDVSGTNRAFFRLKK